MSHKRYANKYEGLRNALYAFQSIVLKQILYTLTHLTTAILLNKFNLQKKAQFSVRKKTAPAHFKTIPCNPNTINKEHLESYVLVKVFPVLTTLFVLALKFSRFFCVLL